MQGPEWRSDSLKRFFGCLDSGGLIIISAVVVFLRNPELLAQEPFASTMQIRLLKGHCSGFIRGSTLMFNNVRCPTAESVDEGAPRRWNPCTKRFDYPWNVFLTQIILLLAGAFSGCASRIFGSRESNACGMRGRERIF